MTKKDSDLQSQGRSGDVPCSETEASSESPSPVESGSEAEAVVAESGSLLAAAAPGQAVAEAVGPVAGEAYETAALRARIEKLSAELEQKMGLLQDREREAGELKDKYLRALAESENARRRMRQQNEESVRRERENMLRELLPVIDNLERAVGAARGGGNGKSIVEGVDMVLASLLDLLKRHGVTSQTAVGQPFDPARHEAIDHVPSEVHPPNTVVEEAHRGYQIGDRVLRPARVVVAKSSGQTASSAGRKNGETPR